MKKNIRELSGKRLRSIRIARKLTQEMLAQKANLHSKYISSLECGRENPTLDVLLKLSEALDVELTDIFSFEHESDNEQDLKKALEVLLSDANPEKLKIALKLLKAIFR